MKVNKNHLTTALILISAVVFSQGKNLKVNVYSGLGIQSIETINDRVIPNFSSQYAGYRESGIGVWYTFSKHLAVHAEIGRKQQDIVYYHNTNPISLKINSLRYNFSMRMPFKLSVEGPLLIIDYGVYFEDESLRLQENIYAQDPILSPPQISNLGLTGAFGLEFDYLPKQKIVPGFFLRVNVDVGNNDMSRLGAIFYFNISYKL